MGTSTNAYLVYGVCLEEGPIPGSMEEEGSPRYLAYQGVDYDGLSIWIHCSSEYPLFILCSSEPTWKANRGSPEEVDPRRLVVPEGIDEKIQAYCKKYDLKTEGSPTPGWLLFSYHG
jgi:hypothetical protein